MRLTSQQKRTCEQVLNAFETSSARGDYSNISIFADGPNGSRQITYGRSQTTEYGNLRELIEMYVAAGGSHSEALRPYAERIGNSPLVDNRDFKRLLREAGRDPVMQGTQDAFFDKRYFEPARRWAETQGFALPLSMLVIYDSFIHSGSILGFLRSRFPELPPTGGGSEKRWITQYVDARHNWLANHSKSVLRNTIYRTRTLRGEIDRDNWELATLPIDANGVPIIGEDFAAVAVPPQQGPGEAIPFLGDPNDLTVAAAGTAPLAVTTSDSISLRQIREQDLNVDVFDLGEERYGDLAREIQACLIGFGFLDPPVDGEFGPLSRRALATLQAYDPHPDEEVINAKLANLLLIDDPDHFLPVDLDDGLASRIFRFLREHGFYFARLPGQLNIVYLEGADANGRPNANTPNMFNDRRLVLEIEEGRPTILGNWEATTEPGRYYTMNPMNPGGAARIAFGQYKAWSVGRHRNDHEALVQAKPVKVYRDLNRDFKREGDRLYEGVFGINQHWGYDRPVNDLGHSSAGCLVGRTRSGHRQFMSLLKSDPRYAASHGYRFLTTIISATALEAETTGRG